MYMLLCLCIMYMYIVYICLLLRSDLNGAHKLIIVLNCLVCGAALPNFVPRKKFVCAHTTQMSVRYGC